MSHNNLRAPFPPGPCGTICSGGPCRKKRAHTQLVHLIDFGLCCSMGNAWYRPRVVAMPTAPVPTSSAIPPFDLEWRASVYVIPSTLSFVFVAAAFRALSAAPMRERPSTAAATRAGKPYSHIITRDGTAHRAPYSYASCHTM
jgi:hypothetical protein